MNEKLKRYNATTSVRGKYNMVQYHHEFSQNKKSKMVQNEDLVFRLKFDNTFFYDFRTYNILL